MKVEVIFATKTGHSKKIASAIAAELKVAAQNIMDKPRLDEVDLLFLVGGIYANKSMPELIQYVQSIEVSMVKKVVLITSSVSPDTKQSEIRTILESKNISVSDEEFHCQGSFLFFGLSHPNKKDLDDAASFAKKCLTK